MNRRARSTKIDDPAAEPFGHRLARLRRLKRLSQSELAARLGVKPGQLSRLEVGQIRPRADLLSQLSEVFGVSADYLLTGRSFGQPQRDFRLRDRIEALEDLPEPQRNHLVEFLDALISAHEAVRKL